MLNNRYDNFLQEEFIKLSQNPKFERYRKTFDFSFIELSSLYKLSARKISDFSHRVQVERLHIAEIDEHITSFEVQLYIFRMRKPEGQDFQQYALRLYVADIVEGYYYTVNYIVESHQLQAHIEHLINYL